ncbi:ATP-binding protein [Streptomyces sp. NPDC047009]|uniref:ATP-binding protein n=1 Tax=unclassified Streptomyces TaxID=2593676 RepID=UPI0033D40633
MVGSGRSAFTGDIDPGRGRIGHHCGAVTKQVFLVGHRSKGGESWTLPRDETSVCRARNLASRQLSAWGLEDLEDSTKLIVSELVTNAVRHASGPIGLCLKRHKVLTCEVSDTEAYAPRPRRASPVDENGRGLGLVAQMSRSWGSRLESGGKVVWAEQDLPRTSGSRSAGPSCESRRSESGRGLTV